MLSEILGERGWNTYMVGKWHLCPTDEMNLAAPRRNWPSGRGFERWYGFLGAETNQWYPGLVLRQPPGGPAEAPGRGLPPHRGHHRQGAASSSRTPRRSRREKPFFLYYAPGACHAPHHAPKEWIEKYKGRFDAGYEAMREETLARQKEMGLVPADTELPPVNPIGTSTTRKGPNGQPFRRPTTPCRGTRCRMVRSDSSRAWLRCTPGSSRTPTTTSGGCSTTWNRLGCAKTPWSSWCPTTAPVPRAAGSGRSTSCCS